MPAHPPLHATLIGTLRVGPYDVPVYEVPDLQGAQGMCSHDERPWVAIRDRHSPTAAWTVFHEALHLIDFQMDLGLKERHVRALDRGLKELALANPALWEAMGQPMAAEAPAQLDGRPVTHAPKPKQAEYLNRPPKK